jgi:hypothetical protein
MVEQAKGVLASHSISASEEASVILRWHAAPQSAGGGRGQSDGCGQSAAEPPRGRRLCGGSATTELTRCPPTLYRRASSTGFAWVGCRADGCWRWLSQGRRMRATGRARGLSITTRCPPDLRAARRHVGDVPLDLNGLQRAHCRGGAGMTPGGESSHDGSTRAWWRYALRSTREKSMTVSQSWAMHSMHTDVTFGSTARCRRFSSFTRASLRSIDRRSALRAARHIWSPPKPPHFA